MRTVLFALIAFQTRRRPPQYILLNGNMPLSASPYLADILYLCTERTWGIHVSLQDMLELKVPVKKSSKEAKDIVTDGAKKAMRCAEFLRHLNMQLESGGLETESSNKKLAATATNKAHTKVAKKDLKKSSASAKGGSHICID